MMELYQDFSRHVQSIKNTQLTKSVTIWLRNINLISSTTAFALALEPTNSARINLAETLSFSANKFFTYFIVTHVSIRTSDTSGIPHGYPFTGLQNVPLPLKVRKLYKPTDWYVILARYIFGAETLLDR